jgi:hypothetical protein
MNYEDSQRELLELICSAKGYSAEKTAQVLYDLDHPPSVGSDRWIQEQAELHVALKQADRQAENDTRAIRGQPPLADDEEPARFEEPGR